METQMLGHVMQDVVIFFTFKVTKFVYWSTNYFGGGESLVLNRIKKKLEGSS